MTARLSPAQQRVVDAMRDGADLQRTGTIVWARWNMIEEDDYLGCEYDRGEVSSADVETLATAGVIVAPPRDPWHHVVYVLAPAYQGGEE